MYMYMYICICIYIYISIYVCMCMYMRAEFTSTCTFAYFPLLFSCMSRVCVTVASMAPLVYEDAYVYIYP